MRALHSCLSQASPFFPCHSDVGAVGAIFHRAQRPGEFGRGRRDGRGPRSAKLAGSNKTITVVSDAKGRYAFPAARLEPGKYAVTIRAAGYDLAGPSTTESRRRRGHC